MAEALRDQNFVPSQLFESSTTPGLTLPGKIDEITGRILVDNSGAAGGTVTSVSVVTANGVSGSVATATTTPAITLTLGAITPTSVNGLTITATTGTFTLTDAKTFAVTNTITLSGTDGTVMTFPTTSATLARTDAGNTFTGVSTASAWVLTSPTITTKISPTNDDGAPLGDTTHNFSDLFLASGAVINFANSNLTLTHSSGIITCSGFGQFNGGIGVGSNGVLINGGGAGNGTIIYPNSGSSATLTLQATTGTIYSTGGTDVALADGGTAASLTASNGGIVYSTAGALAILAGTATANQILLSGASTTPSWSTATYPATAGTSGNVLTSDGTNWTSAAPAGGSSGIRMVVSMNFETTGRYTTVTAAGTFDSEGYSASSTTVQGKYLKTVGVANRISLYDSNPDFVWIGRFQNLTTTGNGNTLICAGSNGVGGDPDVYTNNQFGFKVVRVTASSTISATNGSGTTETATSFSGADTANTEFTFAARKTSTTNIKFYLDKTLKATHTTNLPTGNDIGLGYFAVKGDSTNASVVNVACAMTTYDAS